MMSNMPDQKGKKPKVTSEMVNNVAYNAISRLYNQKTLDRMKAIASGESEVEEIKSEETEAQNSETPEPKKVVKKSKPKKAKPKVTEPDTVKEVDSNTEVESGKQDDVSESEGKETP